MKSMWVFITDTDKKDAAKKILNKLAKALNFEFYDIEFEIYYKTKNYKIIGYHNIAFKEKQDVVFYLLSALQRLNCNNLHIHSDINEEFDCVVSNPRFCGVDFMNINCQYER